MGKLRRAFEALGDDPDYLAELVGRVDQGQAERLRDLFQAVGQLLDDGRQEAGLDDDKRTTAMGLFNFAHSYWCAAVVLQCTRMDATHPTSPRDYLYYHAIELYLKSYLRLQGFSVQKIVSIGHRHAKLYCTAVEAGLGAQRTYQDVMSRIPKNYLPSRYIKTGLYRVPSPDALWEVCRGLHDEIEPQVNAASGTHRIRVVPLLRDDAGSNELDGVRQ